MTVLAVAEHRRGDLRDASFELLTAGREVADALGTELHATVIGGDTETYAEDLNREGVDAIHRVEEGEEFDHGVYCQAVAQLDDALDPSLVLAPNSVNGLDYVPAVAERLGYPLVTDAIDVEAVEGLAVTREMYGSKVETVVETGLPAVVTVREGEWPAPGGSGTARVESFAVEIDESVLGARVTGYQEVGGGEVDITEADVLVSVGRGIGEEENLDLIFDLAEALDATVSSSRPIVDNGWLDRGRQVGQSGKTVTPDVYLAIGISGAVQHVAGMKNADTIVAINNDPDAPIFDIADYGVVGDLFEVVPELITAFEE